MSYLHQVDRLELPFPKKQLDPNESVQIECGRLIHAAVINRRFLNLLLTSPVKAIEAGYSGEKFAFTHAEKQRIQQIRASSLADFSSQLKQAVELSASISSPTPKLAFAC